MSTTSLAPKKLNIETARSFLRDVTNENDVFNVFFGRTLPWNSGAEVIPTPTDTRIVDAEAHLNLLATKRIQPSDVVYLIPKVLWSSGKIYDRYDDDVDLSSLVDSDGKPSFYVFNETNNCIYKCLNRQDYVDGNDGISFPETPGSVAPSPSVTPTISVSTSMLVSPSNTPSLNASVSPTLTPSITPSVTPSLTVSHTVTPSVTPTHTVSPTVTPTHTVSASLGASPTPTPTPTPSTIVTSGPSEGDVYALGDLTWMFDGSDWQLVSTVEPSDISGTEKFQTSDGYWWKMVYFVPIADIEKFIDANNDSTFLPVRFFPSTTAFDTGGYVNSIVLNKTGSGYQVAPSVVITGDGKGAHATARVNTYGEVVSVDIIQGGYGYTFATIAFIPALDGSGLGLGSGAIATARLLGTQPSGQTLNVELAAMAQATAGGIEFVDIQNIPTGRGTNYTTETEFIVVGDGTGAIVDVLLNGTGGIETIIVTNNGTGYTFASIVAVGAGNGAELKPIISPIWGHGGNVPTELLSTTIGVVVDVSSDLNDFFWTNDFRQLGIIKNIHAYSSSTENTALIGDSSYLLSVSDIDKYGVGNTITTDGGGNFSVTEKFEGPNSSLPHNVVRLSPNIDIITEESVLTNISTGDTLAAAGILKRNESRTESTGFFISATGDASYKINVADIANYAIDNIILTDDGGEFLVVEINPNGATNVVRLLPIIDRISINSILTNYTTSPTADIFSGNLALLTDAHIPTALQVLTPPEINKKTGDIIYLKNTAPYIRQNNQTETVKLYLQF